MDLNSADPKIVIVADIHPEKRPHEVLVSRTVNFDDPRPNEPVTDATVNIRLGNGRTINFRSVGDGYYMNPDLPLSVGESYTLTVEIDGEEYTSTTTMLDYIEVETIGVNQETVFNEDYYFINFKFFDPGTQENYYRYSMSINGGPYKFNSVFSDKFNDGNEVTHQLGRDNVSEIKAGDHLEIRRQVITKPVFTYWNEYMLTNPGSAAPGNPTSNISNGALGYFSVSSVRTYTVDIDKPSEE